MPANLRDLILNPNLIPPARQNLLFIVAAQAEALNAPCYLAGGFARDLLLGRPSGDLDVVAEGDAIQLGNALLQRRGGQLAVHPKFRTAVWFLPPDLQPAAKTLDLITARAETYPRPGALPVVRPATMEDDLRRRDFTVNAMAVRLDGERFGELLDPLDGQGDLARGVIRVLHPRSFAEDPTRIFRAVRYEGRYEFQMDLETRALVNDEALRVLESVSGERLRHELDLILKEENAARMLNRLGELGVLEVLRLPAPQPFAPPVEANPPFDGILLGWLLWLARLSLERVDWIINRLSFDSHSAAALRAIVQLKENFPSLRNAKPSAWTFYLEKFPPAAAYALWLLEGEAALREFVGRWRYVKPRANGETLKARGVPPGPEYKRILSRLRAAWLDGEIKTPEEENQLLDALL